MMPTNSQDGRGGEVVGVGDRGRGRKGREGRVRAHNKFEFFLYEI